MSSQVLVLPSDTTKNVRTLLSVPKHTQTSQDAVKTPPRRPRGLQDRPKFPKMTPKGPPRLANIETCDLQNQLKNNVFLKVFRNPASSFPLIFHVDQNRLKISSKSLQELAKMAQDAQQLPTWGQHGDNIGPTWGLREAPRGPKIRSRGGLRPGSPSGLNMDPKWTPFGPQKDPKWAPN